MAKKPLHIDSTEWNTLNVYKRHVIGSSHQGPRSPDYYTPLTLGKISEAMQIAAVHRLYKLNTMRRNTGQSTL